MNLPLWLIAPIGFLLWAAAVVALAAWLGGRLRKERRGQSYRVRGTQ